VKFTGCFLSFLLLAGIVNISGNDWAFTGITPGGHRGAVTAIIHKGNTVISAGEDGFLEIWDTGSGNTGGIAGRATERFQISMYGITAMAQRPGKDEISVVESDGLGQHRVSAWNYRERRNLFTLHFRDPIRYITYSTGGNFIIAAGTGRNSLVFIDPASGGFLRSPESLTGIITLAVTGRSDRNMVVYLPSGELSYWDIASGNKAGHFNVPTGLNSPAFFGNNRYLAGMNREGLAVVNAVSGELQARENSIPADSVLFTSGDDLFCLIQKRTEAELRRYTIDNTGRLAALGRFTLPAVRYTSAAFNGGTAGYAVLGTSAGAVTLVTLGAQAQDTADVRTLAVNEKTTVTDIAVSGSAIALLTGSGAAGFINIDYNVFTNGIKLGLEQIMGGYNRITAFSGNNGGGQFIFWQDKNTRTRPLLRSARGGLAVDAAPAEGLDPSGVSVSGGNYRYPLRSVSSFDGKVLLLDSAGNLTVISPLPQPGNNSGRKSPFTFSSAGLIDAAFVDSDRIILARGAVSGSTPFLLLNINTGETLPLPYPSRAGVAVHRGASGNIYAAVVSSRSNREDQIVTSVIQLNLANTDESVAFVEFQGEAAHLSLTESQGYLAVTVGGESALTGSPNIIRQPDRTPGLPLRFINSGSYLISLDNDGNICWHENRSGKLLAVFSLHGDGWILKTERRTLSGGLETVSN